jgi:hypothetical protein
MNLRNVFYVNRMLAMRMRREILTLCAWLMGLNVLLAGDIWVAPAGCDAQPGTPEAPLQTVGQAVKLAREWRRLGDERVTGGVHIHLAAGTYTLAEELFLRPEDSGTADSPTIIEAAEGERAVLSGGVRVTGWQRAEGNLWVAEAPRVGGRIVETRQLWADGRKAQRAVQGAPGELVRMIDFDREDECIVIPTPANVEQLQRAGQLEMLVHQRWAIAILRVKRMEVEGDRTRVWFQQPESRLEFAHPWPQPVIGEEWGNSGFCLMNDLSLVDEPGEWFQEYPSGRLYYYPREGERMEETEVTVPVLETLVRVDGSLERPVHDVTFRNVEFAHAAWTRPSREGHVTLQGGFRLLDAYKLAVPGLPEKAELENQAWIARPESAVTVKGAHHIAFEGCRFTHLAATAVDFTWAVHHASVVHSELTDIGGTAILMGAFPDGGFETHVPFKPLHDEELCADLLVHDNLVEDATNEDWGCVGIAAGYVRNVTISHNEVAQVNYSGICVGWGWTSLESGMRGNRVEANYVHHFARQLYDVGGLYTLSNQPDSYMGGNRIEALTEAPYATNRRAFYIYFDEATDGYTVENNWCPEVRFDSNRPGPNNVWKKNGPTVSRKIKEQAGRLKY